jgi:hypothetical protein
MNSRSSRAKAVFLLRCRRASVAVVAAIVLPVLVGMVALVADFGHALVSNAEDQRVADIAAYAGGLAYVATGSTAAMGAAAKNAAALNGILGANVTASLATSPRSSSKQAVSVTVQTTETLHLATFLNTSNTFAVSATAYAELESQVSGCVIALKTGGTGVTLSGGASISAPSCSVASNNTVTVPCGTSITAKAVAYDSAAAPSQGCSGISASSITQALTADPLAGNAQVSAATARMSAVAAMTSPAAPATTSGGGNIEFGYTQSSTASQALADGCSATMSGSTWTINCNIASAYNFGTIIVDGGITVVFNTRAGSTYNFNGAITNTGGGTTLTFGAGTFNVVQGITNSGTLTFGAGSFNVGSATSACSGAGKYSVCNTSKLTFGGPSSFVLAAGFYNSGGSTLTIGSGSTNSFNIGASSDGNSLTMGGGATTVFADATGSGNVFQFAGNLNVTSGGGSCLTISSAAQHDINGYVAGAGGMILGGGIYTVSGYVALGASGGGDVTCGGNSVGVSGTGVTFVTGGASTPAASSSCSNTAFCLASGYNHVTLTAPTSGAAAYLLVIGPSSSSNTLGATFTDGASATSLSGAFYFPYGPLSLGGGASVGNGSGQCLELVGSQITLSGGSATASTCIASTSAASSVALVQ